MKSDISLYLRKNFPIPLTEEEIADLVDTFMRDFQARVDELRPLETAPDYTAIRRVTHAIKGLVSNIGADDLASLSLSLNVAAHDANPDACAAYIREIIALYDRYRAEETTP